MVPTSDIKSCLGNEDVNVSNMTATNHANVTSSDVDPEPFDSTLFWVRSHMRQLIVPLLCCVGLLGHVTTMLLTSCRGKTGHTERAVHIWLRATAASGMVFCMTVLPHALFQENRFAFNSINFELLYLTFNEAAINTAIMVSTWLAVVMAVQRYVTIRRPLHYLQQTAAGRSTAYLLMPLTVLCAVTLSVPKFLEFSVDSVTCPTPNSTFHIFFRNPGLMAKHTTRHRVFAWLYISLGVFAPLLLLTICNVGLVCCLRQSTAVRQQSYVTPTHVHANRRVTALLINVITAYIVLVTPAEIMTFLQSHVFSNYSDNDNGAALVTLVELTNILQTVHFSCNFIPYYLLHVRSLSSSLCSCCFPSHPPAQWRSASTGGLPLHYQATDIHNRALLVMEELPHTTVLMTTAGRGRVIEQGIHPSTVNQRVARTLASRHDNNDVTRCKDCCACLITTRSTLGQTDITVVPVTTVACDSSSDEQALNITGV